jgi:hypothetical protein
MASHNLLAGEGAKYPLKPQHSLANLRGGYPRILLFQPKFSFLVGCMQAVHP